MKTETINKNLIKEMRAELTPIIQKFISDKYGLTADIGNASYTDKDVTFKLTIKAEGISSQLLELAQSFGWPTIGTKFRCNGRDFEVVDYAHKRSKPIIASSGDKKYQFTAEDVLKLTK